MNVGPFSFISRASSKKKGGSAQGHREARMFILETNDVSTPMFSKGQKVKSDINLWDKRIDHVNFHWLQELQAKEVVFGLPKLSGWKAQVCEATSASFPQRTKPELQ